MSDFTPKSKRLGNLIAIAPAMYSLLSEIADYFEKREDIQNGECTHYEYMLFERILECIAQIDGDSNVEKKEPEA